MSHLIPIAALTLGLGCGDPAPTDGFEEKVARETLARVTYLIEMLASKNAAPIPRGDAEHGDDVEIRFGKNYDKTLQVPVYLAARQLLAEGEAALDPLLAHVGDKRYSFSVNTGNHDRNVTVSEACEEIADRIIFSFDPELHFITRSQSDAYNKLWGGDRTLAKLWAKKRRRGLQALQLEAVDAMTTYMKSVDGRTASTVHPDAERKPLKEFNRLRDENLRILATIRRSIEETKEPHRAKDLDDPYRYQFGLPWTTRRHNL